MTAFDPKRPHNSGRRGPGPVQAGRADQAGCFAAMPAHQVMQRGDIQVMLLTLSALFFSQLTGQLNCFFLQLVECRLFLKLLLFYIQQRQCLNQFIFTGQHTLFICRQFFPVDGEFYPGRYLRRSTGVRRPGDSPGG